MIYFCFECIYECMRIFWKCLTILIFPLGNECMNAFINAWDSLNFIHLNGLNAWLYADSWKFGLHEILLLLFEEALMNVWKFMILPFQCMRILICNFVPLFKPNTFYGITEFIGIEFWIWFFYFEKKFTNLNALHKIVNVIDFNILMHMVRMSGWTKNMGKNC